MLTKEQRDALAATDFALPEQRKLPIHDKDHVSMAWRMSDALPVEQRESAKRCILRKASQLKIDTSKWHLNPVAFSAMALDFGEDRAHPNKLPFKGVLTRLDVASDKPLMGTRGKCVVLPTEVAREALHSLLGMGVGYTEGYDGHDPRRKIGIITAADVADDAVQIEGFFYASDFPQEVQQIQAESEKMGFSFEAQSLIRSMDADPLVVSALKFTGAAVLYKDKAAYMKTSLAAQADQEIDMDAKELEAALKKQREEMEAANKVLITAAVGDAVKAALAESGKTALEQKIAAAKGQVTALRASATALIAAGLTTQASAITQMANDIETAVAAGKEPPTFNMQAATPPNPADAIVTAVMAQLDTKLKPITDQLGALDTQMKDQNAKLALQAGGPARKTLAAPHTALLEKLGLKASGDEGKKLTITQVDEACKKSSIVGTQSMALKLALRESGLMTETA